MVSFAPPALLARFEQELNLGLLLLSDPDRAAYTAFGFERGSLARVWLDPRVWARYAALLARGQRPGRAQGDTLQLGGDAILDPAGRLAWVHRGRGPEDRPSLGALRAALASLP